MYKTKEELTIELNKLQQKLKVIESANANDPLYNKLLDNNEHYRLLFESNPQPMWIYDIETLRFLEINYAAIHLYGYSKDEFLAMTIKDIRPEEDIILLVNNIKHAGNPYRESGGWRHLKKNGEIIYVEIISHELTINNRNARHVMVNDITERKQAEEKLKLSDRIFNHSMDMLCIAGFDGYFKVLNPAWTKIIGWSDEELRSKPWIDFVHPDDVASTKDIKTVIVDGKEVYQFENRYISKDGTIKWFSWNSFPYPQENIIFAVARDITERKKGDEILKENHTLIKIAGEKAKLGGWSVTIGEDHVKWSDEVAAIHEMPLGYSPTVEEGINFYAPEWQGKITEAFTNCVSQGIAFDEEMQIITATGKKVWVNAIGEALRDAKKNIVKVHGAFQDISERKLAEDITEKDKELLNNFFRQSLTGFFIMMIDEPIIWNDTIDKEKVLDYVFEHQHLVKINQTMANQYLVSEADFMNKTPNELFAQDLKQGRKVWEEMFNNGHLHTITREQRSDGSSMWIEGDYICLYDSLGRIIGHSGNQQDITEKKLAEEELKKSKMELEAFFENDISADYILSVDGYVLSCNNTFLKLFGLAKKPEPGMLNIIDFYKNPEQRKKLVNRIRIERKIENFRADFVNSIGQEINAILNAIGIFDENDKLIKVRGYIVDITKQIKAEAATHLNDNALKVISQGVVITDANRIVISSNAAFSAITGYSESEIIGRTCKFLQGPLSNPLTLNAINEALYHHSEFDGDVLNYHKDGTAFWNELTITPIFNSDGLLTHFIGVTRDITERKKNEEQLQKLSHAVEQSPTSIILTDIHGNMEYVNPKTLEVTGYELSELIGQNPRIFSNGEKPKEAYRGLWQNITSGKDWQGEFHNKKKNGELYWEQASISPILNKAGEITNYLAVKEDITERKLILDDLIIAKELAEQSDKLKSAFLANMSHEIRTPMNGILGFTELLKEPNLSNEKQQKYVGVIQKSGTRLLNIINDIVDISKIEAGLMKTDIKTSNIREQIEHIYTFFKPEFDNKGLHFFVSNAFLEEDLIVETDPEKIYAIFTNLIKNAIKFTKNGLITFGYEIKGEYLEFYVKDTGIGIPEDKHEAIFERFIQADIINDMAIQGTGLGLSITKAYVELLGGKIWLESEVENLSNGKEGGSAFYFTIPYIKKPAIKLNHHNASSIDKAEKQEGNLKILIAEDDESSSTYLSILVEEFGSEILTASNGIEAVEIYKNNPDIDLILMDIQMPCLNGYEATSQIRKLNKNVVIIAQTAYALSYDKKKVIDAGCNDYIAKPISVANLTAIIKKHFN